MKLSSADIESLFEKIATTLPAIAHDANDPKKIRFYGFNASRLSDEERSKLNFDTLVLGLSLPGQPPFYWNYKDSGTATQKLKYFEVSIIGKFKDGDLYAEDVVCGNAEEQIDFLQSWLREKSFGASSCYWPLLKFIDVDNMAGRRLSNIGIGGYAGAALRITLMDYVLYDNSNPLNDMAP